MNIRVYQPEELSAILVRASQTAMAQVSQREQPDAAYEAVAGQIHQMYQMVLRTPGSALLVADWPPGVIGQGPAGYVLLMPQPNPFTGAKEMFVMDIFTDPRLRGARVGKQLLEFARWYARFAGCQGIAAQVALHNPESLRLFTRSGYQPERVVVGQRC